jgi:hypothetical protein
MFVGCSGRTESNEPQIAFSEVGASITCVVGDISKCPRLEEDYL